MAPSSGGHEPESSPFSSSATTAAVAVEEDALEAFEPSLLAPAPVDLPMLPAAVVNMLLAALPPLVPNATDVRTALYNKTQSMKMNSGTIRKANTVRLPASQMQQRIPLRSPASAQCVGSPPANSPTDD
jgi:hypothetical protein